MRAKRWLVCYLGGSHRVEHSSESMNIMLGIYLGSRITDDESVSRIQVGQVEQV